MVNGIEKIAITKLDVFDDFDEIKVCIGYEYKGKGLKSFPADVRSLEHITPVYESFAGWKKPLSGITSYTRLPDTTRRYIEAIAHLTGTPVWLVSVGPRRDQTILLS
jgi:adenylosuccinate synthase